MSTMAGHILSTFYLLLFLLFLFLFYSRKLKVSGPSTENESCGHRQCHIFCGTDCLESPVPALTPRGRQAMTLLLCMLLPVWEQPVDTCLGGAGLWEPLAWRPLGECMAVGERRVS